MQMYRIHRFSKLTGLSTHVIRAWEKRYGLVTPARGVNRYRLYNDEDVRLFRYLKAQVDRGISIGDLAEIGREQLLAQIQREFVETPLSPPPSEGLISELTQALQDNERVGFERKLNGALAVIPFEEALHRFLLPCRKKWGDSGMMANWGLPRSIMHPIKSNKKFSRQLISFGYQRKVRA